MKQCITIACLLLCTSTLLAEYIRLNKADGVQYATLTVPEGNVLEFTFSHMRDTGSPDFSLEVEYDGNTFIYPDHGIDLLRRELVIVGPATIRYGGATAQYGYAIFEEIQTVEDTFVPMNSVVIPENPAGNVAIILESSIDGITWNAANPGIYGSENEARFFRVRAERVSE